MLGTVCLEFKKSCLNEDQVGLSLFVLFFWGYLQCQMDNKWIGISEFIPKVWTSLFVFIQGRSTRQNQTLNHCVPIC